MDLRSTYNRIAEDWYRNHINDDWWVEATDKFISFLKPADLVLDVGCGGGVKSKYLIEKGLRVMGIDFSEKMIDIAKRHAPQGTFRVMDMRDLARLSQKFDGIFIQAALLHIPKAEVPLAFSSSIRQLKPGGYLYVGVKEVRQDQQDEEVLKENDYGYDYERFFSYFTLYEIKKYFTDFHMRILYENIVDAGRTRWIQVIGRS